MKDGATRTLENYLGAFKEYDDKIGHHVQILRELLMERGRIEGEATTRAAGMDTVSREEPRPRRCWSENC